MNKSLNEISFKELKQSPYFVLGCAIFLAVLFIALISYSVYYIFETKTKLVDTRTAYANHLVEVATLEELRAQSQKAQEKLESYKEVLPDNVGDIFLLQESVENLALNFNLETTGVGQLTDVDSDTKETLVELSVKGSFANIIYFMEYVSELKQIHRVDSIALTSGEDKVYEATLQVVVLSQDGSTGVATEAAS